MSVSTHIYFKDLSLFTELYDIMCHKFTNDLIQHDQLALNMALLVWCLDCIITLQDNMVHHSRFLQKNIK